MATLTPAQREAGKQFRAAAARRFADLVQDPLIMTVPPELNCVRHECARGRTASERTVGLQMREQYWVNPELAVDGETVPEGFFAFTWTQGTCRGCGLEARSPGGNLVLASDRPPIDSRPEVLEMTSGDTDGRGRHGQAAHAAR